MKAEIKMFFDTNEDEDTIVSTGKFIAVNAHMGSEERSKINTLSS